MQPVSNPIQACNEIFYRPNRVFYTLKTTSNWSWVPFFLVCLAASLVSYMYFSVIDFEWYVNLQLESMGDMSPAEEQQFRQMQDQTTYMYTALAGPFIALPLLNLIVALYLHLTTKSDADNVQGYTDWYGLTWWTALPAIISALVALLIIALSDHQISPNVLQPTSLAFIFGVPVSSSWSGLASSVSLITLWSVYLTACGIAQWTSFSTKKSAIVAAAPYIIIFSIWCIITLL